jgi:hypothetical protein
LSYHWSYVGPAAATFSDNDSNAAKYVNAQVGSTGTYTFLVTLTDGNGLSASSSVNFRVLFSTITTLVSSSNSMLFGQTITLTATVSSGASIPNGSVNFTDGETLLGTAAVDASGVAQFSTAALSVGNHAITASFTGSGEFAASTSATLTQTVRGGTTTTLTSSSLAVTTGQSVTFTAQVSPVNLGGPIPTGLVYFMDGTTVLGTGTLDVYGAARYTTALLTTGVHSITAVYVGSDLYLTSTSPIVTETLTAPVTGIKSRSLPR